MQRLNLCVWSLTTLPKHWEYVKLGSANLKQMLKTLTRKTSPMVMLEHGAHELYGSFTLTDRERGLSTRASSHKVKSRAPSHSHWKIQRVEYWYSPIWNRGVPPYAHIKMFPGSRLRHCSFMIWTRASLFLKERIHELDRTFRAQARIAKLQKRRIRGSFKTCGKIWSPRDLWCNLRYFPTIFIH